MVLPIAQALAYTATMAWEALPSLPSRKSVEDTLTDLFTSFAMFACANAVLALRGSHPAIFITGYFTGIVLDKLVQENFEKIVWVAPIALSLPLCLGQEGLPYLVHTVTFIAMAKIGSALSLNHNKGEPSPTVESSSSVLEKMCIAAGAGMLWLINGHPFFLLAGFLTGTFFEKWTDNQSNKMAQVAFGNGKLFIAHSWFTAATLIPHVLQTATFVIAAKIGSRLSIMFRPKPDGHG